MLDAALRLDASEQLELITTPTLVLHRELIPLDLSGPRELAARIPTAQLTLLEGESASPYIGDSGSVFGRILQFCTISVGDHQAWGTPWQLTVQREGGTCQRW